MQFLRELKRRNRTLFWYGALNFAAAIICVFIIVNTNVVVNNINAFIKPLKFFLSIGIFCWTMGWIMHYLAMPSRVSAYNTMAMIVFTYESVVITWQAANGRLSHFNNTTSFYLLLFNLMGVAIVTLTLWTGYIGYLFFRKKEWQLPMSYVWGIRLGILLFVFFALEGGVMASALKHTVGGDDNGNGLLLVNWNRTHGDLRIAHFFGMHSLQLLPLAGYYLVKTSKSIVVFSIIYAAIVIGLLIQALLGIALF